MIPIRDNYRAWNIEEKEFPKDGTIEEKIYFFLRYGILAPSTHNTQLWKFDIRGSVLEIMPDWSYRLPQADPTNRGMFISLGCCLTNIVSAAAYFGFTTTVKIKSSLQLPLVQVHFSQNGIVDKKLIYLQSFITKRYSNKLCYDNKPIKKQALKRLRQFNVPRYLKVILINHSQIIAAVARIHQQATAAYATNKRFGQELSLWMRRNSTHAYDGMPGFTVGLSGVQSLLAKQVIKHIPVVIRMLAKKDKHFIENSPAIGIIASRNNAISSWIQVGKTYEELALLATSLGINSTVMAALIENKKYSIELAKLLNLGDNIPQMFFRLGYSNSKPYHTPRRKIETFLMQKDTEQKLIDVINADIKIKRIKIDNYNINYIKAGNGSPLLLIHGGNIGWGQWYPNIKELAKYFKIYAIDLPGGGRSSRIAYETLDAEKHLVQIVESFIKKLDLSNVKIIGASIGGWIGLRLAIRKNITIDKLIVVDSIGFTNFMRLEDRVIGIYPLAKFLSQTILKPNSSNKNVEKFMRDVFYNKNLPLKQEFIDYFYETMETSHNLLFISKLSNLFNKLILVNDLPKVKNKILIIWGEHDKLLPPNKIVDNFSLIPHAKVVILKDAGHIPSIEKSHEFNDLVIRFLNN